MMWNWVLPRSHIRQQVRVVMDLRSFLILSCLPCVSASELLPARWFEELVATDGSTQRSLVFRTVPGVSYRVEVSDDLDSWETVSEIYGLGQEHPVPLVEMQPAPAGGPAPPPVPPPTHYASIVLRRSSGSDGGLVLSWPSLDSGLPMKRSVAGSLVAGWDEVPLFADQFDDFHFFISHPGNPAPPPQETGGLGVLDAAMVAAFSTHLGDMNAAVAAQIATARAAPSPAVGSEPRGFVRISANWSLDTDRDGTPDFLEFRVQGTAGNPNQGMADSFSGDTNQNGVPDGGEVDSDGDGLADSADLDPGDELINWGRLPIPTYAMFPVTSPSSGITPRQINSQGMVLFPDAVWIEGQSHDLVMNGPLADANEALGMNDKGQILGIGYRVAAAPPPGASGLIASNPILVWWNSRFDNGPTPVSDGVNDAEEVCLDFLLSAAEGGFPHDQVLDNEGRFVGQRPADDPGGLPVRKVWRGSAAGFSEAETTGEGSLFVFSPPAPAPERFSFGSDGPGSAIWDRGVERWTPDGPITRMAQVPGGGLMVLGGAGTPAKLLTGGGTWEGSDFFPEVLTDSALTGAFPLRFGGGFRYLPPRLEDKARPWPEMAPGVPNQSGPEHLDAASNGWVLSREDDQYLASMPVVLEDDSAASGVDHVSVTSTEPGDACENRTWVMAPIGKVNGFQVRSGAGQNARVTMNGNGVPLMTLADFWAGGGGGGSLVLEQGSVAAVVDGAGINPGLDGAEILASLSLGGTASVSRPIGFKVMKERTVRISVVPVVLIDGIKNFPPQFDYSEAHLESELDKVFGPQVNLSIDVSVEAPVHVDWDVSNDHFFDVGGYNTSSLDQDAILSASGGVPAGINIRVFVIGTYDPLSPPSSHQDFDFGTFRSSAHGTDGYVYGIAQPLARNVWISGCDRLNTETQVRFDRTLAHEIGHVFMDWDEGTNTFEVGHPGPPAYAGVAPLPSTRYSDRLMVSGNAGVLNPGFLLVKGEWDRIEEWAILRGIE